MSSLRARLLAWLLGSVALLGIAGGWFVYRNALAEADAFFDYHLRQTALFLRDQPVEYLLAPQLPTADAAYDFVVQVWSLDGVRVYLSRPHAVLPEVTTLGFATVATSEGRWRAYGVQALTRVIQVAQPMSVRERGAAQLALQTLIPFALLLPVLALVIWLAVGHALQPLQRLTSLVKARRVNALDALPDERLPEEVQPLVAALNDLISRLRAALERERAFMADAAHELRTPLTALHLQMGMLARASDESERSAAMETLSAGVQRAIRLVEQLLALARQEPRADAARVAVPLAELARAGVAELVPLADARHIDLGLANATEVSVRGDPEGLRTLVRNLVDNAVRYTPAGGRVDVSVEDWGAGARLSVSDNGPGIAPDILPRIFEPFAQFPDDAAHVGSAGLGLYIAKEIVEAHNGRIFARSELRRGTTFTVDIPVREEAIG